MTVFNFKHARIWRDELIFLIEMNKRKKEKKQIFFFTNLSNKEVGVRGHCKRAAMTMTITFFNGD
jgi:hypothetical protein